MHVVVDPLLSNILRPHQREVSLTKTMTNVEKSNDNLYDDCIMRQYFFCGCRYNNKRLAIQIEFSDCRYLCIRTHLWLYFHCAFENGYFNLDIKFYCNIRIDPWKILGRSDFTESTSRFHHFMLLNPKLLTVMLKL